jgi:hypothetical protein
MLDDRFGGSRLSGTTAQTLLVATTSAADIPQILAAGTQPKIVTRSPAELIPIKQKLDEALPAHSRAAGHGIRYTGYRDAGQCSGFQAGGEGPRGSALQGAERALTFRVLPSDQGAIRQYIRVAAGRAET